MSALATLVARRLCHDLAGPAGAIATVTELLGETAGGRTDPELQSLLADSSAALLATLRLHRFVLSGGESGDYRACLAAWVATREDVALHWTGEHQLAPPAAALLLGLATIAVEAAPGAAALTVAPAAVTITATRLTFDAQIAAALAGTPAATPRGALAALLCQAAAGQGRSIAVAAASTKLELTLVQSELPLGQIDRTLLSVEQAHD